MTDLPSRLRAMAGPIVPNVCTEAADEIERSAREVMTLLRMLADVRRQPVNNAEELTAARTEIERLRAGGCVRDQRLTQYCAEAAAMQAELAACRIAYEQAVRDRDAARLAYCRDVWQGEGDEDEMRQLSPREIAGRQGWPWPIPGSEIGSEIGSEVAS